MGDVSNIHGDIIVSELGCNEDCTEVLEDLIEQARSGEIVGFVGAVQYRDNAAGITEGGYVRRYPVVGALMALVNKLTRE